MKLIEHIQGSDDWKKWRNSKITATSASVLLGNNPWKDKKALYDEMMGITPPQEMNSKMLRGQQLEPEARALAIKEIGMDFVPIVCESTEYPWMGASLDGWNEENKTILEIKCGSEKLHEQASRKEIPQYYLDQIAHQIIVTQANGAFYVSYRPESNLKMFVIRVLISDYHLDSIIKQCKIFYFNHLTAWNPPETWTFKARDK